MLKFGPNRPLPRGWLTAPLLVVLLTLGNTARARAQTQDVSTLTRASDLVKWGRWKEARALLQQVLDQPSPTASAPLMAFYAHVLTAFGEREQALQWARKSVAADPNCVSCHLFLAEALGERAKAMAHVRAAFEINKIRSQLDRAQSLDPKDGDVQWGWLRFELELPAVAGGSLQEAAKHADELAAIDPVEGLLGNAMVDLARNQPDKALADYEAAAEKFPANPSGSFNAGMTLYLRGDYPAAEPYLTHAESLEDQSPLYTGYLAADLVRLGREPEARKLLEQAAKLYPDSRLPDFLVAQALVAMRQDVNWARELLQAYLQVPPEPDQPTAAEASELLASLH